MEIKFENNEKKNIITISLKGRYENCNVDSYYSKIRLLSDTHNCKKVVVDYRELDYQLSPLQIASLPDILRKHHIEDGFIYAIVINPKSETAEKFKLSTANYDVKILLNKVKVNYKIFNSLSAANEWINSEDEKSALIRNLRTKKK